MKRGWKIKSIKHWDDGHWDALVVHDDEDDKRTYDRCLSDDGFKWKNKYGRKVLKELQVELTQCMGDMLDQNIRVAVLF